MILCFHFVWVPEISTNYQWRVPRSQCLPFWSACQTLIHTVMIARQFVTAAFGVTSVQKRLKATVIVYKHDDF